MRTLLFLAALLVACCGVEQDPGPVKMTSAQMYPDPGHPGSCYIVMSADIECGPMGLRTVTLGYLVEDMWIDWVLVDSGIRPFRTGCGGEARTYFRAVDCGIGYTAAVSLDGTEPDDVMAVVAP